MAVADVIRWALALTLAAAAGSKLSAGTQGRAALATFGLHGARVQRFAWWTIVSAEAALAFALAADVPDAEPAAAALLACFALALGIALARGRGGAPCACFGPRSRVGRVAVARAALLATALAVLPALPHTPTRPTVWLAIGLGVAFVGLAALTIVVLALAREVGELRLAVGPQSALSIEGEGPELGSRPELIERFARTDVLAVAIFSSPGCRLCHALEPAVRLVAREPGVTLEVFDEQDDADLWSALRIPGSPFAVVMNDTGTVLATGTFNTLAQLEGLLAGASRHLLEPAPA